MKRSKVIIFFLTLIFAVLSLGTLSACGKKFTVTFNGNGGFLVSGEVEQTVTKSSNLVPPEFGRYGYDLTGWDVDLKSIKNDTTVNAVWTVSKYKIIYDLAGGRETEVNPREYTIESKDITLFEPEKTGYDFIGWTGTGVTNATKNITINSGSYGIKIFTAHWTVKNYSIKYYLDGGELVESSPSSYTIVSVDQHVANPVRRGYDFTGWTGTGLNQPSSSVIIPTGSYGDREYTATWKAKEFKVSFNADGGTVDGKTEIDPLTVAFDSAVGELPVPEKGNMIFEGWYYGDEKITSTTVFDKEEDIELTARYAEHYTVKFVLTSKVGNVDVVCYYDGESTKADEILQKGEKLSGLLDATPSPKYSGLYDFENWVYVNSSGQEIVVTADTVFDQTVFTHSTVYLTAKCKAGPWTPPITE